MIRMNKLWMGSREMLSVFASVRGDICILQPLTLDQPSFCPGLFDCRRHWRALVMGSEISAVTACFFITFMTRGMTLPACSSILAKFLSCSCLFKVPMCPVY